MRDSREALVKMNKELEEEVKEADHELARATWRANHAKAGSRRPMSAATSRSRSSRGVSSSRGASTPAVPKQVLQDGGGPLASQKQVEDIGKVEWDISLLNTRVKYLDGKLSIVKGVLAKQPKLEQRKKMMTAKEAYVKRLRSRIKDAQRGLQRGLSLLEAQLKKNRTLHTRIEEFRRERVEGDRIYTDLEHQLYEAREATGASFHGLMQAKELLGKEKADFESLKAENLRRHEIFVRKRDALKKQITAIESPEEAAETARKAVLAEIVERKTRRKSAAQIEDARDEVKGFLDDDESRHWGLHNVVNKLTGTVSETILAKNEEALEVFDKVFDGLRKESGVESLDELVELFIEREHSRDKAMEDTTKVSEEVVALSEAVGDLRREIEAEKARIFGENSHNRRQVRNLEDNYEHVMEKSRVFADAYRQTSSELRRIADQVTDLLNTLGIVPKADTGPFEAQETTIVKHLAVLERHLLSELGIYVRNLSPQKFALKVARSADRTLGSDGERSVFYHTAGDPFEEESKVQPKQHTKTKQTGRRRSRRRSSTVAPAAAAAAAEAAAAKKREQERAAKAAADRWTLRALGRHLSAAAGGGADSAQQTQPTTGSGASQVPADDTSQSDAGEPTRSPPAQSTHSEVGNRRRYFKGPDLEVDTAVGSDEEAERPLSKQELSRETEERLKSAVARRQFSSFYTSANAQRRPKSAPSARFRRASLVIQVGRLLMQASSRQLQRAETAKSEKEFKRRSRRGKRLIRKRKPSTPSRSASPAGAQLVSSDRGASVEPHFAPVSLTSGTGAQTESGTTISVDDAFAELDKIDASIVVTPKRETGDATSADTGDDGEERVSEAGDNSAAPSSRPEATQSADSEPTDSVSPDEHQHQSPAGDLPTRSTPRSTIDDDAALPLVAGSKRADSRSPVEPSSEHDESHRASPGPSSAEATTRSDTGEALTVERRSKADDGSPEGNKASDVAGSSADSGDESRKSSAAAEHLQPGSATPTLDLTDASVPRDSASGTRGTVPPSDGVESTVDAAALPSASVTPVKQNLPAVSADGAASCEMEDTAKSSSSATESYSSDDYEDDFDDEDD